jgi:hypothetical protein
MALRGGEMRRMSIREGISDRDLAYQVHGRVVYFAPESRSDRNFSFSELEH